MSKLNVKPVKLGLIRNESPQNYDTRKTAAFGGSPPKKEFPSTNWFLKD